MPETRKVVITPGEPAGIVFGRAACPARLAS